MADKAHRLTDEKLEELRKREVNNDADTEWWKK